MKKEMKNKNKPSKKDQQRFKAFIASFFTIIGFILTILFWKEDKYVMYYAKHGLVLFILQLILGITSSIPFAGKLLYPLLLILFIILWAITWINSISGKTKETPIISEFAKKIEF